jgi:pyruvate dehydrogenase E2 component (dihydrolipoamide acetyltransferase)
VIVEFRLPDLGEGIAEAEIVEWLVQEGDFVSEHQPIVTVETDKAVVEVPSPVAGRILRIRHRSGDILRVGEVLVTLEVEGSEARRESVTVVGSLDEEAVELPPQPPEERIRDTPRRSLATPAVRRLARELGVSLEEVRGSGRAGRITEADVREHAARLGLGAAPPEDGVERIPLRGVRRTIARRLRAVVARAALATHMDEVDATALVAFLRNGHEPRAPLPWIVRATIETLRRHRRFNAVFDEEHEELRIHRHIHLGIAIDTRDGLMVPVMARAERLGVGEVAAEIERLADACRRRAASIRELRGGTFSISNIGALGGLFATPIPNDPEVAILATGRIVERLVRSDSGAIETRYVLPVSLAFDHRVLDGADAARFTATLREFLAQPERLATPAVPGGSRD